MRISSHNEELEEFLRANFRKELATILKKSAEITKPISKIVFLLCEIHPECLTTHILVSH